MQDHDNRFLNAVRISVIIPVYNQAGFLSAAIVSALAQTQTPYEIIVVDDGSSDQSSSIAQSFGPDVRYFRQPNLGVANARNAGIQAATCSLIAFLDSDDIWFPDHLSMLAQATKCWPDASTWITGGVCLDIAGRELSQRTGYSHLKAVEISYHQLLRANAILPSAALVRRDDLLHIGSFAADRLLSGCEDWDLWLRIAASGRIISLPKISMGYRLHGTSASEDTTRMCEAAKRIMERAVGPEPTDLSGVTYEQRLGWGGAYRFCALSALVRRGDWSDCISALKRAFIIDPSLVEDSGLFYELALGAQPLGYRGSLERVDLTESVGRMQRLLQSLEPVLRVHQDLRPKAAATAWSALARAAYNLGDAHTARIALRRLLTAVPSQIMRRQSLSLLLRSTLAWPLVKLRRRLQQPA